MDKKRLKHFEELLKDWKAELIEQAKASIGEEISVKDEDMRDITDLAALESNRAFYLRLRDRERKLINKINSSLTRIHHGTFGECDECGDAISEKRLEARPVATLCIRCKEEQERQEGAS